MREMEMIKRLKSDLIAYMKVQNMNKLNVVRSILNEINIRDTRYEKYQNNQ
jgi:uncharacterized protein YqeY